MSNLRISILASDVSSNCMGRCYLLAKILERHFDVEIVGPAFAGEVWMPTHREADCRSVSGLYFPGFIPEIGKLLKQMRGDIIYAHKPLFTSFTVGLLKKLLSDRPLILDIDDFELPLVLRYHGRLDVTFPNSYCTTVVNDKLTFLADYITVASRFLQRRYGGEIILHARDTNRFAPEKYDRVALKDQLGIARENKVVAFLGTPRPYKGLEDLINAIAILSNPQILFLVIGLSDRCAYSDKVRSLANEKLQVEQFMDLGLQQFGKLPEFISVADLVVIPQRVTLETEAQVPAKVFDAMAMAKPIIATRVSDLPEILDGCGYIAEPDNPQSLARTIQQVFEQPDLAEEMAYKARQKCIRDYSWDAMEKRLVSIFGRYE